MARKTPTTAEAKRFRHMAKKFGIPPEVIEPWLPSPGKRGRRTHEDQLASIELFMRIAMRDHNMSRHRALRWQYDSIFEKLKKLDPNGRSTIVARFGRNADAAVARVSRKLRRGGYEKLPLESLMPRKWSELGVDPSRFKF
jgi:hypothetical protein